MASRALRAASVMSSNSLRPSRATQIPVVAKYRRGGVNPAGGGVVPLEAQGPDAPLGRLALAQVEAGPQRGGHLDGRAAALAVALGEVGVAGREQRALRPHREQESRTGGDLPDVDIAAVLAGRDGPQPPGGDGRVVRHRPAGLGRAGPDRPGCGPPGRPPGRSIRASRSRDGATPMTPMKGAPSMRTPGRSSDVAQPSASFQRTRWASGKSLREEPEARDVGCEPERLGDHLQDLGHEQVARLGTGHGHRPGEWVDQAEVDPLDVLPGGAGVEGAVEGVTGVEHHLVAGVAAQDRRDVGVPAVVARMRFGGEGESAVDPDLAGRHRFLLRVGGTFDEFRPAP